MRGGGLATLPGALRRPLRLLAPRTGRLVEVLGLMVVAGALEGVGVLLLVPLLSLVGIGVPPDGPLAGVARLFEGAFGILGIPVVLPAVLGAYVLLVAAQSALRRRERVRSAALVEERKAELRERAFQAVAWADWPFHLRARSSDVVHVLTEEVWRVGFALEQTLVLVAAGLTAAVYAGLAFYLSPLATLLALGTALLLLALLRPRSARSRQAGEDFSAASESMYFAATEFLAGIKTAKSHADEARHTRAFGDVTHRLAGAWVRTAKSYADVQFFFTTGAVVVLSLLVWAAVDVIHVQGAALLVLIFIFFRLIPRLSGLQNNVQQLLNAAPAHERVDRLLNEALAAAERGSRDEPARSDSASGALDEGIRLLSVRFEYPGADGSAAVRDVTLDIPARRTTALVGPSGGGKTTLADLVIGLLRPQAGEIRVDGELLAGMDPRRWRDGIGYVPQESFFFNDTILANLVPEGAAVGPEAVDEALRLAQLGGFVASLPDGLHTVVGERGVRLSGGERQRLALARALIRRPSLLILDEATSALDYENESLIQDALRGLHGETTVLIITHRLSMVRDADRIHVVEAGRVVESGTWEELMRGGGRLSVLAASGREAV